MKITSLAIVTILISFIVAIIARGAYLFLIAMPHFAPIHVNHVPYSYIYFYSGFHFQWKHVVAHGAAALVLITFLVLILDIEYRRKR